MRRKLKIANTREFLKKYIKLSYFLNLLVVCMATVYYLGVNYNFIGHIIGFLFIFVFFYDLGVYHKYGFIPGNEPPAQNPAIYAKYTPSTLVDANDPPCIIFHGTSDSLVPYNDGVTIQNTMKANDNVGILIKGYFGAHGHNEAINYGSVAMYYLKRFLYLIK